MKGVIVKNGGHEGGAGNFLDKLGGRGKKAPPKYLGRIFQPGKKIGFRD